MKIEIKNLTPKKIYKLFADTTQEEKDEQPTVGYVIDNSIEYKPPTPSKTTSTASGYFEPITNYFDAKTFTPKTKPMQETTNPSRASEITIVHKIIIAIIGAILFAFAYNLFASDNEAERRANIARLDYAREVQLKSIVDEINLLQECAKQVAGENGSETEITDCKVRTLTPNNGTGATASGASSTGSESKKPQA